MEKYASVESGGVKGSEPWSSKNVQSDSEFESLWRLELAADAVGVLRPPNDLGGSVFSGCVNLSGRISP